jgi:hypothetical protein
MYYLLLEIYGEAGSKPPRFMEKNIMAKYFSYLS